MPKFSIITPTLLRSTLPRMLDSLDIQTFRDYEHLMMVDIPARDLTSEQKKIVADLVKRPRTHVHFCPRTHGDWGHSCRYEGSRKAKGEYLFYLDDDDYLADMYVLVTLAMHVREEWAIFPVEREGNYFFNDPPARCSTTLSSFVVKREKGMYPKPTWPSSYQRDADYVEGLLAYLGRPQVILTRPLVVIPKPNEGRREI